MKRFIAFLSKIVSRFFVAAPAAYPALILTDEERKAWDEHLAAEAAEIEAALAEHAAEEEDDRDYECEDYYADLAEQRFLASEFAPDDGWRYDHLGTEPLR